MEGEVVKQFIFGLIRGLVLMFLGMLVSKGLLPQEFVDSISDSTVGIVSVFGFAALVFLWGYLKTRYNVIFNRTALAAPPETPIVEVKKEVLENNKAVLPL